MRISIRCATIHLHQVILGCRFFTMISLGSRARFASTVALIFGCLHSAPAQTTVAPQSRTVLGDVDPRYVSYNVEAVEVTGGRFWAPYKSIAHEGAAAPPNSPNGNQPAGLDSSRFQYRPPIDLSNPKLRKLAAALGPAF